MGERIRIVVNDPKFVNAPGDSDTDIAGGGGAAPYGPSQPKQAGTVTKAQTCRNADMQMGIVGQQQYKDCLERETVTEIKNGLIEVGIETVACVALAIKAPVVCEPLLPALPAAALCAEAIPYAVGIPCEGNLIRSKWLAFVKARDEARAKCEKVACQAAEEYDL